MNAPRQLVAALLLLGLAVVTVEESYIHSDDGCALETHCNACLLQLGTAGIVDVAPPLLPLPAAVEFVVTAAESGHLDVVPRGVPSRGPPSA
jgi:hypothetical protein